MWRLLLCLVVVLCLGAQCSIIPNISDGDGDGNGVQSATLTHQGFDFSLGDIPADEADLDGEIIWWAPSPTVSDLSNTDQLWWRPKENYDDNTNYTKDMGAVSLASVTTVPTEWDAGPDEDLPPLQVNHVYVVKCLDGYAKFLVKSIDNTVMSESIAVDYVYTSGTTFSD